MGFVLPVYVVLLSLFIGSWFSELFRPASSAEDIEVVSYLDLQHIFICQLILWPAPQPLDGLLTIIEGGIDKYAGGVGFTVDGAALEM